MIKPFCAAVILAVLLPAVAQATDMGNPYYKSGQYNPETYSFTADVTGNITGYFVSRGAAVYDDQIGLLDDGKLTSAGFGLDNQDSSFGQAFNFGEVHQGDTLTFELKNLTIGSDVFSNASMNSAYDDGDDQLGHNHIYSEIYAGGAVGGARLPPVTYVAFEDLQFPSSDFNYDDDSFVFTDVKAQAISAIPEPSAWTLLIAGVGMMGTMLRLGRRRQLLQTA